MTIGVPKEIKQQEFRVALPPSGAYRLIRSGHRVDSGERAGLARTGRRLADQIERTGSPKSFVRFHAHDAIGETPMAATGTVALPFPLLFL